MKDKSILLFCGAGFIGLHLAKRLSEFNKDITILSKHINKAKKVDLLKKLKEKDINKTMFFPIL